MCKEMIENAYVKGRNKLSQFQHKHFHPSGDPKPSREDIDITDRLVESGKIIGIKVLDHIIIGQDAYYSFKEEQNID